MPVRVCVFLTIRGWSAWSHCVSCFLQQFSSKDSKVLTALTQNLAVTRTYRHTYGCYWLRANWKATDVLRSECIILSVDFVPSSPGETRRELDLLFCSLDSIMDLLLVSFLSFLFCFVFRYVNKQQTNNMFPCFFLFFVLDKSAWRMVIKSCITFIVC